MTAPPAAGSVAIVAGSGDLPILVADRLRAQGRPHRILAFRGFADRALKARADCVVGLLDIKRAVACLDEWRPAIVTLAGGLRRPAASAALDAFAAFRNRDEIARLMSRGDDTLLRGVMGLLEEKGHAIVGVQDLAPELMAAAGIYGAVQPNEGDRAALALGFALLDHLSAYDIGQAAVIRGGRVLAIEGPEGTDRMLARASGLRARRLMRRSAEGGVLVKAPKRGQDLRVDLPAIGPRTVANAARAGLAGIAIESGSTLVLDREGTIAAANRLGLFLVGAPRVPAS